MINAGEILNFITPVFLLPSSFLHFGEDILQTFFFTTILSLFIITTLSILINANEKNWNKVWYKKDKTKKFNAEYITVDEVSEAAETKSEKLANAMPSILLTVGLLGTFIGLGIALDKASTILSNTNSVGNTEDQMIQLMAMLDGLGAKFKTSTWGLSAFILLKFILSFIGYEGKRLDWSASKVKEDLDNFQVSKKEEKELTNTQLSNQLDRLTSSITKTLLDTQTENKQQLINLSNFTQEVVNYFASERLIKSERFNKKIKDNDAKHESSIAFFTEEFKKLQNTYTTESEKIKQSIIDITEKNKDQQEFNRTELSKLTKEIKHGHNSNLEKLNEQLNENRENNKKLTTLLNKNTEEAIKNTNKNHQESKSLQNDIISQNKDVRDAMVGFIEKNEQVVDALSGAASNMSSAASDMGISASQLEIVISNLRNDMEGVIGLLKDDLSKSITDMNTSFSENVGGMTNGLQDTISDMNSSFKSNISDMSGNLKGATEDISKAVKSLSSSVNSTMSEVTQTIKESMDLQEKSQKESSDLQARSQSVFIESTNNLNSYIIEMVGLVNKLSDDITSGLKAVSTSNRNVITLSRKWEDITDNLGSIDTLNDTLSNLEKALTLKNEMDFSPILDRKNKHHEELLFKIDSMINSASEAKENISVRLLDILQNRDTNELKVTHQEACS